MRKLTLLALAAVSATALTTSLPAFAASAVEYHLENAWKSNPAYAKHPYEKSWSSFEQRQDALHPAAAARSQPAAAQQMGMAPGTGRTASPAVPSGQHGAQRSFAPGTTSATRHHGMATSDGASTHRSRTPASTHATMSAARKTVS